MRLFGAPKLTRADVPVTFDTRKAVALLAYLAVTGRPQRRESLAALLWPESDQSRARASLRRTLSAATGAGPALLVRRGEIELATDQIWCDVTAFESLASTHEPSALRQAAALAPDGFLAGFSLRDSAEFDDWSAATAHRLREGVVSVLARLADVETAAGRLDEAIVVARRWVELDPLSEAAHRELMRLHTWTGERPTALKQYRSCVRNLDRELGVAPLPATTELYDAIRANRLDPAPTSQSAREIARPLAPSPTDEAPALQLIGRALESATLVRAWRGASDGGGGAVIVGATGLGRTALASQLRTRVEEAGGSTVSLRGHAAEISLAYAAIIDLTKALSLRDPTLAEPLASVGQAIESPGERVRLFDLVRAAVSQALTGPEPGLLLVDDAHWLDPTSFDLLGYLLRRPPPGVLVLATLRSDAFESGILDEVSPIVTLKPWSSAETTEAVSALGTGAEKADETFRRTAGNPRLVVEYALATGAGGTAPLGQLRDLVGARLDAAPVPTRQMLGAIAVIGTLAGPGLIRQVSGRDELETVQALEDAVTRGLLVEDVERLGYDFPYDTLRNMVLGRIGLARLRLLNGRAADALIHRHVGATAGVATARVAQHLALAGREAEASEWFWNAAMQSMGLYAHREAIDHLRSALALGHHPAVTHAATGDAQTSLGRYDDALVAYEQAAAATNGDDPEALAVIEHKLAEVHNRLGDWDVARAHLESATALLADQGNLARRAQVAADLALVSCRQGDPGAAQIGAEALLLAESSGDPVSKSQAKNVLGVLALARGEPEAAARYLEASRSLAKSAGSSELEVAALNNLARVYAQAGAITDALEAAEQALSLGLAHGDLHRVAALHDHLADLLHQAGQETQAMEHLKAAAVAFGAVDDARIRPEVWKLVSW